MRLIRPAAILQPLAGPVAKLVGRDTARMDVAACRRAAVESLAENLVDGFIAPVFWYALAGLPGLVLFKAVSTMDSMVGYKSDRYRLFGWCAARLDDLLVLVPAPPGLAADWAIRSARPAGVGQEGVSHRLEPARSRSRTESRLERGCDRRCDSAPACRTDLAGRGSGDGDLAGRSCGPAGWGISRLSARQARRALGGRDDPRRSGLVADRRGIRGLGAGLDRR